MLEGLRVVQVCQDLSEAPLGYEDIWRAPSSQGGAPASSSTRSSPCSGWGAGSSPVSADSETSLDDGAGLLICSDICDEAEYEALKQLVRDLCCREEPPQLLLLLPGPPPPGIGLARERYKSRLKVLLEEGFDDVIPFQPSGFDLCLHVHAKISATRQRLEAGLRAFQRRRLHAHQHAKAKHIVDYAMWHYLPAKVTRMIPRVMRNLHPQPLRNTVAGHTFVKRLGGGFYGQVYSAVATHVAETAAANGGTVAPTDALKVVDKSGLFGMREIKMLHHMITVHNLLSSPRLQHPNIALLRNIYHSPTHLFFRMEYAGPESLYARLAAAGRGPANQGSEAACCSGEDAGQPCEGSPQQGHSRGTKSRPISTEALRAVLDQATVAIAHLHLNAGACHRDLKLENFVVAAGTGGIADIPRIKLVDFDFARIVAEPLGPEPRARGAGAGDRHRCHGKCGTVPYVAPEVAFERSYDGMSADVWSLGVLFLEVLCGVRVMENTFDIEHKAHFSGGEGVESVAERIRNAFEEVGYAAQLLEARMRDEARPLPIWAENRGGLGPLLNWMLTVSPDKRADMAEVQVLVDGLSADSAMATFEER